MERPRLTMDNTKNTVKKYLKRYFIDAMGAMALGLFASLLIGTIFKALGMIPHCEFLAQIGGYAQSVAGPAMAVAIAYSLCKDPLVIFSSAAVGYAANLLGAAGVGTLQRQGGQLERVLQESLLRLARDAVELVHVDEQRVAHGLHHLTRVVELQAV